MLDAVSHQADETRGSDRDSNMSDSVSDEEDEARGRGVTSEVKSTSVRDFLSSSEYLIENNDSESHGEEFSTHDNSLQDSPQDSDESNVAQTSRNRTRKRDEKAWKQNHAKQSKNPGRPGISKSSKHIKERSMGPPCTCRSKCCDKISEAERQILFKSFWNLNNRSRQWDYLARKIQVNEPKERRILLIEDEEPKKKQSFVYSLSTKTNKINVCRTMFTNTFGINKKWLETISLKKKLGEGEFISSDMRGKHKNRPKRISPTIVNSVREHIDMFPAVEYHCCQQSLSKVYLSKDLNIRKMYRLYVAWMEEKKESYATESFYRYIFNNFYNLSFLKPKKDQCNTCFSYKSLLTEDKLNKRSEYDDHLLKKKLPKD